MNEKITEQQASVLSRKRRDEYIETPDGGAYRNGVKISAADRARSAETSAQNDAYAATSAATGRIGGDAYAGSGYSPSSAFRTSAGHDAYASARAEQITRENAAAAQQPNSPERVAAAADREKEIVASREASGAKWQKTAEAIRTGKPMPAGVSVSAGGDPNQTIDNPDGAGISRAFKDGTEYALTGRNRAERIADAKRKNIYERIIAENPGNYPESNQASQQKQLDQTKADRAALAGNRGKALKDKTDLAGVTRAPDGGIIVTGSAPTAPQSAPTAPAAPAAPNAPVGPVANAPVSPVIAEVAPGTAYAIQQSPSFVDAKSATGDWSGNSVFSNRYIQGENPAVQKIGNAIGNFQADRQRKDAQARGLRPTDEAIARGQARFQAAQQRAAQLSAAFRQPASASGLGAPSLLAQATRINGAAQGTPVTPSLPPMPGVNPVAGISARRRPPLITAFRSGSWT